MPRPTASLPVVELSVRRNSRHPWIYRKMCRPAEHAPGTLVEVIDREGRFAGRGIYNRKSQIALRLLTEDPEQPLDEPFLEGLLARAVALRHEQLELPRLTDAYRVVNAEGDGLSGLVVDRYGAFLVVELFSIGWFRQLKWLTRALERRFPGATVLLRADESTQRLEGFRVRDFELERLSKLPDGPRRLQPVITEGGLKLKVDLRLGHKTGFFCDQREQRLRVRALARGLRVLDGCCYTGGFALNAARGGAASVLGVDLDEAAVALARANAALNGLQVEFRHADLFDVLRQSRQRGEVFDLVILDPPKFAAGRTEAQAGLRRYFDLNRLAGEVIAAGGTLITCSCSGAVSPARFRGAVLDSLKRAGRQPRLESEAGAAADHPLRPEFPEGRYLKVLTLRLP